MIPSFYMFLCPRSSAPEIIETKIFITWYIRILFKIFISNSKCFFFTILSHFCSFSLKVLDISEVFLKFEGSFSENSQRHHTLLLPLSHCAHLMGPSFLKKEFQIKCFGKRTLKDRLCHARLHIMFQFR